VIEERAPFRLHWCRNKSGRVTLPPGTIEGETPEDYFMNVLRSRIGPIAGFLPSFRDRLIPLGLAALIGFSGGMGTEHFRGSSDRTELQNKLRVAEMERDTLRWQVRGLFQHVAGQPKEPASPELPNQPQD
jgi:hypothetical protein